MVRVEGVVGAMCHLFQILEHSIVTSTRMPRLLLTAARADYVDLAWFCALPAQYCANYERSIFWRNSGGTTPNFSYNWQWVKGWLCRKLHIFESPNREGIIALSEVSKSQRRGIYFITPRLARTTCHVAGPHGDEEWK